MLEYILLFNIITANEIAWKPVNTTHLSYKPANELNQIKMYYNAVNDARKSYLKSGEKGHILGRPLRLS